LQRSAEGIVTPVERQSPCPSPILPRPPCPSRRPGRPSPPPTSPRSPRRRRNARRHSPSAVLPLFPGPSAVLKDG
jgi:hypothetical protein